jgi:hypothetical protein
MGELTNICEMKFSMNNYPYQNTSLKSIRGESWEDIPGLDGYFLVSNYGRVKRCTYEMQYRNGAIYVKPEKIIKLTIVKQPNKFVGDTTFFLTTGVTLSGKRHNFTVARLVYYCFVRPFDLADDAIMIVSVDGDNFNIHPENLRAVNRSQRQQRIVDRKRFRSPLLDLTKADKAEIQKKVIRTKQKQVSQYSLNGKRMRTYSSIVEAQRATGISYVGIAAVAHGRNIRAGGWFWRWGKEGKIDIETFLASRRKKKRASLGQKVTQYTLSGDRIERYASFTDAYEATGASTSAIGQVIRGTYKSAKGYFWKKGYGPAKIDLTGYKWGKKSAASTQAKRVAQYSLSGKYIQTFDSIKAAAAAVKVGKASLSAASRGLQYTCRGWRWKAV